MRGTRLPLAHAQDPARARCAAGCCHRHRTVHPGTRCFHGRPAIAFGSAARGSRSGERATRPSVAAAELENSTELPALTERPARVLHVCDDLACHAAGAPALTADLEAQLGPAGDARAGAMWLRSPCLGLCEHAPAAMVTEATAANTMPMMPPNAASATASIRNCSSTSRSSAPMARRRPISRVRSVTLTSMTFMMPMPPTRRLTSATPANSDVIVSVDTARRQAKRKGVAGLTHELCFLSAHGLCHLLGYDHQTDAEERDMTVRTRTLEAAAGARSRG